MDESLTADIMEVYLLEFADDLEKSLVPPAVFRSKRSLQESWSVLIGQRRGLGGGSSDAGSSSEERTTQVDVSAYIAWLRRLAPLPPQLYGVRLMASVVRLHGSASWTAEWKCENVDPQALAAAEAAAEKRIGDVEQQNVEVVGTISHEEDTADGEQGEDHSSPKPAGGDHVVSAGYRADDNGSARTIDKLPRGRPFLGGSVLQLTLVTKLEVPNRQVVEQVLNHPNFRDQLLREAMARTLAVPRGHVGVAWILVLSVVSSRRFLAGEEAWIGFVEIGYEISAVSRAAAWELRQAVVHDEESFVENFQRAMLNILKFPRQIGGVSTKDGVSFSESTIKDTPEIFDPFSAEKVVVSTSMWDEVYGGGDEIFSHSYVRAYVYFGPAMSHDLSCIT